MEAVAMWTWFEGVGGTRGAGCLWARGEGVLIDCDVRDLTRGMGEPSTSLPLVSCRVNCSCGGGGIGEIDTAVIEAE